MACNFNFRKDIHKKIAAAGRGAAGRSRSFLAESPRGRRGDIDVETAVAAAKPNARRRLSLAQLPPAPRRRWRPRADRYAPSPAERGGAIESCVICLRG
jgi:hypothetical protein